MSEMFRVKIYMPQLNYELCFVVGSYVTLVYSLVKLLHLSNTLAQFYLLNKFLGTDDYTVTPFTYHPLL